MVMRFVILLLSWLIPVTLFAQMQPFKVSDNGRFFVHADGSPFFYLGDTAWELLHRLSREEMNLYFRDRAAKGFTVVQCVILSEVDGLTVPNAEGNLPLHDMDLNQPNEAYFELVDYAVERAKAYGLRLGLLPTWGRYVKDHDQWKLFTPESAERFGTFLGERWKGEPHIFWIIGGDRGPEGQEEVWDKLALGLHKGDGGRIMTYHIYGGRSSSEVWQNAPWIDFHMIQSGHMHPAAPNFEQVAKDYALSPIRPTLDGEPNYEGMPIGFKEYGGRFGPYEVRRAAYWSVFAGGAGVTYGHNSVWQMHPGGEKGWIWADLSWREAIHAPGSAQMIHLRKLMESRPYFSRIPDQEVLLGRGESWPAEGYQANRIIATRDGTPGEADATYFMVYYPNPYEVNLNTSSLQGDSLQVWWYDPRTGLAFDSGIFPNPKGRFSLPGNRFPVSGMGGPDWVLVVEDASQHYPAPGQPSTE